VDDRLGDEKVLQLINEKLGEDYASSFCVVNGDTVGVCIPGPDGK